MKNLEKFRDTLCGAADIIDKLIELKAKEDEGKILKRNVNPYLAGS
ncbi:hypothetical protein [Desulfosporosinus youngiae]|nr:hypothetical protein [Desulfosporosinus youngiae]